MPRFFEDVTPKVGDVFPLCAENSKHISKVLRMRVGESITVCNGTDDIECIVDKITPDAVFCRAENIHKNDTEPDVRITLFQCMPKSDKMETVIQKSVELGVDEIVPVMSMRCVSRPDEKKGERKGERWSKIAKSASEQSGRGKIVGVMPMISLDDAIARAANFDVSFVCYEGGGESIKSIITSHTAIKSCAVFVGPEGGFDLVEIDRCIAHKIIPASLGKRILRTETAPLAAIAAVMILTGNMD